MDYKYKAFCIIDDSGSSIDLARALSKEVEKVYYYREWKQSGFPGRNANKIATNIPGVIKVENIESLIDNEVIDCYIFTDVYRGSQQEHLLRLGKRVFGSRRAEVLELYRHKANEVFKQVGLPVIPTTKKVGVTDLIAYSKENKDIYLKINKTRGLVETQYIPDYDLAEFWFDDLIKDLGSDKDTFEFFLQDKLPSGMSEVGLDPMITDGRIPEIIMGGVEAKDSSYICVVKPYIEFPDCMREVTDKLMPVFAQYDYRGNFSYEAKVGKEHKPFVLDLTQRIPQPPGSLQWFMYRKNLATLFYSIASGIPLSPEIYKPFGVEIILKSEMAKKEELPIRVPKEIRDHVFLTNYKMREGKEDMYYILPQPEVEIEEVGSVTGEGDTLKEAFEQALAICEKIECMDIRWKLESYSQIQCELDKLDELELNFFTLKVSEVKIEKKLPEAVPEVILPKRSVRPVSGFLKKINETGK